MALFSSQLCLLAIGFLLARRLHLTASQTTVKTNSSGARDDLLLINEIGEAVGESLDLSVSLHKALERIALDLDLKAIQYRITNAGKFMIAAEIGNTTTLQGNSVGPDHPSCRQCFETGLPVTFSAISQVAARISANATISIFPAKAGTRVVGLVFRSCK